MKAEEFNEILRWRLAKTEKVLAGKAGEYASAEDRLHNFKEAALMLRCTPAQALLGFMTKHMVSIYDLVLDDANLTTEIIDEKIGDAINYLILLEAVMREPILTIERATTPPAGVGVCCMAVNHLNGTFCTRPVGHPGPVHEHVVEGKLLSEWSVR